MFFPQSKWKHIEIDIFPIVKMLVFLAQKMAHKTLHAKVQYESMAFTHHDIIEYIDACANHKQWFW